MKLKAVLKADEYNALPDAIKELYTLQGENYFLEVDPESVEHLPSINSLRQAHSRLKTENASLKKQLQETIDKYKDIDPEKAREAAQKLQELQDKELLDTGKVEELIQQRTGRMQADHQNQITGFQNQLKEKDAIINAANGKLADLQIQSAVTAVLTSQVGKDLGIVPQAIPDIIRRAKEVYKLDANGKIMAYQPDGSILYGKDPAKPMDMPEWLTLLKPDCPHYFAPSTGGGSDNKKGGGGGVKKRSDMNETERAEFIHNNGQEAYFKLPA